MIGELAMERLGMVLWGAQNLNLVLFKEEGENRKDIKKAKHLEVINDLLVCVPNTKVLH
jgi:hypothetical protein